MSFHSLVTKNTCRVTRETDIILDSITITAAPIVNLQPPRTSRLHVEISGCTSGTGTVTINGTVDGVADTEILTFVGPAVGETSEFRESTKEFTAISSIATNGFVGEVIVGNIEIKTITASGQPILQEKVIFASMNCWVDLKSGGITIILPGGVVESVSKLFCEYDSTTPIFAKDIIYYDELRYLVEFVEKVNSRSTIPHHLELGIKRFKAT